MVTARQYGGLGNRLFQKAAAIGYAMKHGKGWGLSQSKQTGNTIHERGHSFQSLPDPTGLAPLIVLNGYWQSEKYFSHCREEVLKALSFNWEPFPGWCSIHVRRGDYLLYPDKHPVITTEYLDAAISYICKNTDVSNFLVFSDDIPYCKEWIEGRMYHGGLFKYSEGHTETEDLELMSGCEHHIISNSTFSWWGAWLNQNPNKVIVSPSASNWFGPGNAHLDTRDIIPDSWIQIKY